MRKCNTTITYRHRHLSDAIPSTKSDANDRTALSVACTLRIPIILIILLFIYNSSI